MARDQDRAEIVHIGAGRAGCDQVADRVEHGRAVVGCEPARGLDPGRSRACQGFGADGVPYAGTVGVSEETYRALLRDIATSFKGQGFRHIVFIGDSDGIAGMEAVALELDARWHPSGPRVHHIPEHYDMEGRRWLAARGVRETDEGYHDEFAFTAQLLALSPDHVRAR